MLRSKDHELYSMCIIFVRITVTKLEGEVYIIQLENGKGGVGLGPILMIVRFGEKYNNHCQITRVGVYSTKMQESSWEIIKKRKNLATPPTGTLQFRPFERVNRRWLARRLYSFG